MDNLIVELKDAFGHIIGTYTAKPTEFKSGSTGWTSRGKAMVDGAKVQVNMNVIMIGSKPKEPKQEPKEKKSSK